MMILGLDIGDKRIGVAIADLVTKIARPLTTLANNRQLISKLRQLQQTYGFTRIVIGLPVTSSGHTGDQARKTVEIADRIKLSLPISIVFEDERMTSQDAKRRLKEVAYDRSDVDSVSASIILDSWLARRRKS